jgi:hypothetical protein
MPTARAAGVGLEGITQLTGTVKSTVTKWVFRGGTVERPGATRTETTCNRPSSTGREEKSGRRNRRVPDPRFVLITCANGSAPALTPVSLEMGANTWTVAGAPLGAATAPVSPSTLVGAARGSISSTRGGRTWSARSRTAAGQPARRMPSERVGKRCHSRKKRSQPKSYRQLGSLPRFRLPVAPEMPFARQRFTRRRSPIRATVTVLSGQAVPRVIFPRR